MLSYTNARGNVLSEFMAQIESEVQPNSATVDMPKN